MALAQLEIRRVVQLVGVVADPLIERLRQSGETGLADKVALALSPMNPRPVEIDQGDWKRLRAVLDAWADEHELHPRVEQLRQFVAPAA